MTFEQLRDLALSLYENNANHIEVMETLEDSADNLIDAQRAWQAARAIFYGDDENA